VRNAALMFVADVGATKTHTAEVVVHPKKRLEVLQTASVFTKEASSFCDLLDHLPPGMLKELPRVRSVGIGAAGVLKGARFVHPEIPYPVDVGRASRRFGWRTRTLVNDTEGQAWYLQLPQQQMGVKAIVKVPRHLLDASGGKALVVPGSGLGIAGWTHDEALVRSEFGNTAVPVVDHRTQKPFLEFLEHKLPQKKKGKGRIRVETIVSGGGISLCIEFLYEVKINPREVREELHKYPKATALWAWYLGLTMRNAFLACWATRGIFLFGGVLERNPEILEPEPGQANPALLAGLYSIEKWDEETQRAPVLWITDPLAALKGVACATARGIGMWN
jgi:glucokinase